MRVQMLTLMAGPSGVREVGGIYELEDEEARALLDGGFAVAVEEPQGATEPAAEGGDSPGDGPAPRRRRRA
ncbi:MAG TPA: hypothetical protein VNO79_02720 [Actinomycetota bacterium]|nr:hypothetical protein [Actinomycetota bacterium]